MTQPDATESARSDLEAWRDAVAGNAFDADPFFQLLLRRHLGDRYPDVEARLRQLGEDTGAAFDRLAMEASRDENLPVLRRHDADGRPVEEVVFHPAYHDVGRVFWSSGVLELLSEPGHELDSGATSYLLDQHGEAGHACPVACTAGAIKLLQQVGTDAQQERYLPALLDPDYERRLHAAQFVTELQGGSDVGLNACVAVPEPERQGWYRITGEKWFCSVADAGLFVVSARQEGGPPGTRGLGLFLVPRRVDGTPNSFVLRRLKYKLGTRSMATGEIEFTGALGEAIGPLDDGFRNLVGIVLDASRIHNAVAACGIMRRALWEARGFSERRLAFEKQIRDFPSVQEILARMRLRTMAGLASTFRLLAMTDLIDTSDADEELIAARRIGVMINKYWTALASTRCARDGIEILGGNGTIEDFSVLPRLYRDAIVVESWEGTHNTLCAQVLRDFAVRGLHRPWLSRLAKEIGDLDQPELSRQSELAGEFYRETASRVERLLGGDAETAAAHMRHLVDRMCRLTDWVALLDLAQWELEHGDATDTLAALDLYRLLEFDRVDPMESEQYWELVAQLAAERVAV
jgi:alkylation response protein AidB-like acyl-CoA dehydrogenase